jgi:hypothetical protein
MDGILNWRGTDDDHSECQFNSVADSNYGICLIILYSGRTFWVGLIFSVSEFQWARFLWQNLSRGVLIFPELYLQNWCGLIPWLSSGHRLMVTKLGLGFFPKCPSSFMCGSVELGSILVGQFWCWFCSSADPALSIYIVELNWADCGGRFCISPRYGKSLQYSTARRRL